MGLTVVEDFAHYLARAERNPLTIKNYRGDLIAFATWFMDTNGEELTPSTSRLPISGRTSASSWVSGAQAQQREPGITRIPNIPRNGPLYSSRYGICVYTTNPVTRMAAVRFSTNGWPSGKARGMSDSNIRTIFP
jgi:hypothetical protein